MAISIRDSIVGDNLDFYLDAGNPNSYVSGATKWLDLINGRVAQAYNNTVVFETDVQPCFNFGTATGSSSGSSSLGFSVSGNPTSTTSAFTFSCYVKGVNTSSGQVGLFSNAGSGNGYRFGVGQNGIYVLCGPTYNEGAVNFNSSITQTDWYHVSCVYDRPNQIYRAYLNGEPQGTKAMGGAQSAMQNGSPGIVRSACCSIYTGKLAMFMVHNKALSAAEQKQIFNATRTRFGI